MPDRDEVKVANSAKAYADATYSLFEKYSAGRVAETLLLTFKEQAAAFTKASAAYDKHFKGQPEVLDRNKKVRQGIEARLDMLKESYPKAIRKAPHDKLLRRYAFTIMAEVYAEIEAMKRFWA